MLPGNQTGINIFIVFVIQPISCGDTAFMNFSLMRIQ